MPPKHTTGTGPGPIRQSARVQEKQPQPNSQDEFQPELNPPLHTEPGSAPEDSLSDSDTENAALRVQLQQMQEQINTLLRQSTDRAVPSIEPLPMTRNPVAREATRARSGTPAEWMPVKLSEKTPKIESLSDGKDPTYRQWRASIQDQLDINSDHYPSERARMALI
ncbi:hypothetical protein EJ04DRAFT_571112 [Polyplosphaeria fusca]|uniref:Uncharacterized protein n=1 Tax=Polyplosphaeria fusca TaxID=682080 RepID=A0A9P4UVC1_9PLEO|nr:hypothetical protein EJ04DRAFT_571112 [Polyplosphaeria fusca]